MMRKLKIKIGIGAIITLLGLSSQKFSYSEQNIDMKSLAVPKTAAERVMGEIPRPAKVRGQRNVQVGVVCYDDMGRVHRSEDQGYAAKDSSYSDCLEGNPTQNLKENEKNIEMKMGVDLPMK